MNAVNTILRVAALLVLGLWFGGVSAEEEFTYEVQMPDGVKYEVQSPEELTDYQAYTAVIQQIESEKYEQIKYNDPGRYHLEATMVAIRKCTKEKKLPPKSCRQLLTPEKCLYTLPLEGRRDWGACILVCGHASWYDKKFGECSTELDPIDWKPKSKIIK